MSEFVDCLGLPKTIRHAPWKRDANGKPIMSGDGPERLPEREYTLSPPDSLEVLGAWESYLEDQAFQAILRRYRNNPAGFAAAESNLNGDIVAGKYSVYGQVSLEAYGKVMGPAFRKMIYFQLAPNLPQKEAEQIAEEFAKERQAELYHAMKTALTPEDADPKGQPAPAGANGSVPSSPNLSISA